MAHGKLKLFFFYVPRILLNW